MLFLERIRIFTVAMYVQKWRIAVLLMAVASMVLSPGGDPYSMLMMLVPLILLYFGGIWLCKALHSRREPMPVEAETYAGDKGYDDTDLHYRLQELGKHSALRLRHFRTGKKDRNKEVWLELEKTPEYQAGLAERYKIERKYGEAKHWHGFGRCRYLGLQRYGIQAFLMVLALNLKRIVQLLTGAYFYSPSRKRVHVAA
jgi:hypothetical protein